MRIFVRILILAAALHGAALGAEPGALAQSTDPVTADELYKEAAALAKAGKYSEACRKFAQSHQLDPAYGAIHLFGVCEAKLGHTATAYIALGEALEIARKEGSATRIAESTKEIRELVPQLTSIILRVIDGPGAANITIRINGKDVDRSKWSIATPVDPGARVEATAPGKKTWSTSLPLEDVIGRTLTVEVPVLVEDVPVSVGGAPRPSITSPTTGQASPGLPQTISPLPEPAGSLQRGLGWVGMGVGVVSMGVGAALGGIASAAWNEARPYCNPAGECDDAHLQKAHSAYDLAMGSTVSFIVGGGLFTAGLVSRLTAPSQTKPLPASTASRLGVTPWLSDRAAGITLKGKLW